MATAVLSNYLRNKIVDHVLRNTAWTTPGTALWLALYTTNPTAADTGTEVTGTNYARKQVTAWDSPGAGRATQNTSQIAFDAAGAGGWTGPITHWGLRDNSSGGNLLFCAPFNVEKTVGVDDTLTIAAGDLDFAFTGAFSNYLGGKLIDHMLRNTAYTTPGTSVYAALYTSDPTAADTGAEVSGSAYARNQITAWDAPSNGATQNTNAEIWSAASGGNWGTVTHAGLRDNSSGGNLLFFGQLAASKIVNDGDVFQFNAGALDLTVT